MKYKTMKVNVPFDEMDLALMKRVAKKAIELDIAIRQFAYSITEGDAKEAEYGRIEKLRKALDDADGINRKETLMPLFGDDELFTNFNKWVHTFAMPFTDKSMYAFDDMLHKSKMN